MNIQSPSSGSTNYVRFTIYKHAHINWPQHTPLNPEDSSSIFRWHVFMHFQLYSVSERTRPIFTVNKPLITLCCYYNYTPCIHFHIISTSHCSSNATYNSAPSNFQCWINPNKILTKSHSIYIPHLKLCMATWKLSVFRKNGFNMQYMNNSRCRWPCSWRSLDCK